MSEPNVMAVGIKSRPATYFCGCKRYAVKWVSLTSLELVFIGWTGDSALLYLSGIECLQDVSTFRSLWASVGSGSPSVQVQFTVNDVLCVWTGCEVCCIVYYYVCFSPPGFLFQASYWQTDIHLTVSCFWCPRSFGVNTIKTVEFMWEVRRETKSL